MWYATEAMQCPNRPDVDIVDSQRLALIYDIEPDIQ